MFETTGREAPEPRAQPWLSAVESGRGADRPTSTSVASGVLREGLGDVKHILPSWALQGFFKDKEAESPGKTAPVDWSTVEAILYGPCLHRKLNLLQCETPAPQKSGACPVVFWNVSTVPTPETFSPGTTTQLVGRCRSRNDERAAQRLGATAEGGYLDLLIGLRDASADGRAHERGVRVRNSGNAPKRFNDDAYVAGSARPAE